MTATGVYPAGPGGILPQSGEEGLPLGLKPTPTKDTPALHEAKGSHPDEDTPV